VVAAGLHLVERSAPSVYDGLPPPEGPYRYTSPPPTLASSNQPPLAGTLSLTARDGQVAPGGLQTADGQAALFWTPGALRTSPSGQGVTVTIEPVPPPLPVPAYEMRGNVYRFAAVEAPSGAPVTVARPVHVTIRFPPGPFERLQWFDGRAWHRLENLQLTGSYATAAIPGLGDVAATAALGSPRPTRLTALDLLSRRPGAAPVGAAAVAVLLAVAAIGRTLRRRRK
jgi:hypothetical protein